MQITRTAKPAREIADVKLWHCRGCGVVHMSVGKAVLNFDRKEFADFAQAVVDINYSGWPLVETSIFDLLEHDADSYLNASVH